MIKSMTIVSINEARNLAKRVASRYPHPLFYEEKKEEIALSRRIYDLDEIVGHFRRHMKNLDDDFGHGINHSELVAIDSGAIVAAEIGVGEDIVSEWIGCIQTAGLLHDIKRKEKDHAQKSADEAKRLLGEITMDERSRSIIVYAIRNHEAFKEEIHTDDDMAKLISGALYDADKFRWGPDNFTTTLWDMLGYAKIDVDLFLKGYQRGIEGIRRIKDTFRTKTGKEYGPEFIDLGLKIGEEIYKELLEMTGG
jgi:hypothetical protein